MLCVTTNLREEQRPGCMPCVSRKKAGRLWGQQGPHGEGRACFPGQLSARKTMGMASLGEQGSVVAFLALGGESTL